jgi:uncharacterized membrane protein
LKYIFHNNSIIVPAGTGGIGIPDKIHLENFQKKFHRLEFEESYWKFVENQWKSHKS